MPRTRILLLETAIKFLGYLNYEFLERFIWACLSSRSALRDQRDLHVTLRKTLPKHSNSLLYHTKTSKQVSFIFNINIIFSLSQKVKAMWAIFDSLVYANYWFMLLQRPYSQLRPFIPMFWQSLKKFQFFYFQQLCSIFTDDRSCSFTSG